MILDSKKIDYEKVDIAGEEGAKTKMREVMGDPKGLPPRLTKGDVDLGVSSCVRTCRTWKSWKMRMSQPESHGD